MNCSNCSCRFAGTSRQLPLQRNLAKNPEKQNGFRQGVSMRFNEISRDLWKPTEIVTSLKHGRLMPFGKRSFWLYKWHTMIFTEEGDTSPPTLNLGLGPIRGKLRHCFEIRIVPEAWVCAPLRTGNCVPTKLPSLLWFFLSPITTY